MPTLASIRRCIAVWFLAAVPVLACGSADTESLLDELATEHVGDPDAPCRPDQAEYLDHLSSPASSDELIAYMLSRNPKLELSDIQECTGSELAECDTTLHFGTDYKPALERLARADEDFKVLWAKTAWDYQWPPPDDDVVQTIRVGLMVVTTSVRTLFLYQDRTGGC